MVLVEGSGFITAYFLQSEILFSAFRVIKENNIEIPFPQRDLHLRLVDAEILLRNASEDKKQE